MIFKEIVTEYDFYTLFIYGRKIKLIYRIRQYQKLKNQDKDYIANLKKNGVKLKHYKTVNENGENVDVCYYKPYGGKLVSRKNRVRLIYKILKIKHPMGLTLNQQIELLWTHKNYSKLTTDELMDKEAIILDTLSSYFIGGYEGKDILNQRTWEKIREHEGLPFLDEGYNAQFLNNLPKDRTKIQWEKKAMNKKRYEKMKEANKAQLKRWRKSTTYKLLCLFSYDNHKDTEVIWEWRKWSWIPLNADFHIKRDALFNSEVPCSAEWCIVDAQNEFWYKDSRYQVNKGIKAYEYDSVTLDCIEPEDDFYSMDRILVVEQDGLMHFFDMNIDKIDSKYIVNYK